MSGYDNRPDPSHRRDDAAGRSEPGEAWVEGPTPAPDQSWKSGPAPDFAAPPTSWPPITDPQSDSPGHPGPSASHTGPSYTNPSVTPSPPVFPAYPYGTPGGSSAYANPQDEAYAAYQGYQAGTGRPGEAIYPEQGLYPMQSYPTAPGGAHHNPYGRPLRNAPFAIPSLVLGLASFVSCGITGPIGLGLGIAALKQINGDPATYKGRTMATVGVVTGALGTLWILFMLLGIALI